MNFWNTQGLTHLHYELVCKGYIWVHRLVLSCEYGVSPLLSGSNVEYLEGETWQYAHEEKVQV